MTGLSPKPVTNQTPHIQTNNANSDGLTGFSGKNLRNAHAREATLPPPKYSAKGFAVLRNNVLLQYIHINGLMSRVRRMANDWGRLKCRASERRVERLR